MVIGKSTIWRSFEEKKNSLFSFANGKRIVLWGYGLSGWFLEYLFQREHRQIEYIMDDGDISRKIKVYNSFILKDLDRDTHAVILSFNHDEKAEQLLQQAGYEKNIHYIYARDLFYGEHTERPLSYYHWLEYQYGVDLIRSVFLDEMEATTADNNMYGIGIDYSVAQILDNFLFSEDDAVFDFGCGKGGALCLFQKYGVQHFGGVEYDLKLYKCAKENFKKLGLDASPIVHGDAAKVKEPLDRYNYFFMYNPFVGDTFRNVVNNIEESFDRKPRRIILIYQGAHLHREVIANGRFKLAKEIYTDTWCRYVNVYTMMP